MRFELPEQPYYRNRERFLIFPKCINGEVRWLERAAWCEQRRYDSIEGRLWYAPIHWLPLGTKESPHAD